MMSSRLSTLRAEVPAQRRIHSMLIGAMLVCLLYDPSWAQMPEVPDASGVRSRFLSEQLLRPSRPAYIAGSEQMFDLLKQKISVHVDDVSRRDALERIAALSRVKLAYSNDLVRLSEPVTLHFDETALEVVLNAALHGSELEYKLLPPDHLAIMPEKAKLDVTELSSSVVRKSTRPTLFQRSPSRRAVQGTIMGTVTDSLSGEPLPGVNVVILGTQQGASTDASGRYTIPGVSSGTYDVQASFIGFATRIARGIEVVDGEITIVDFQLSEQAIQLDQIVTVAYGEQRRRDVTGSISTIDVDDLSMQAQPMVENLMQGLASGVNVSSTGQPGEQPKVTIRGLNTFGDSTPLYVVDGVPTQDISDLNPNDIQSLQVMKDAGAASIYGARAANGVVVITTRRGRVDGGLTVNYDSYFGWQAPPSGNVWNLLSPLEQAEVEWLAIQNTGGNPSPHPLYGDGSQPRLPDYINPGGLMEGDPGVDPRLYYVNPLYTDAAELNSFYQIIPANKEGTNWYEEIFSTSPISSNNISISGGGANSSFMLGFNYLNQQGTLMNTYLERYTARVNTQFHIRDWLRVGENLSYSIAQNPRLSAGQGSENAIGMTYRMHPIIPVYDIMGNLAGTNGDAPGAAKNPVGQMHRTRDNRNQVHRLFGNVYAEIDLLPSLTFRSSFGGDLRSGLQSVITYPEYENTLNVVTNAYGETSTYRQEWTATNALTYRNTFGRSHAFEALLGGEVFEGTSRSLSGSTQSYFILDPDFLNLSTGSGERTNSSFRGTEGLVSVFGRINYSFADKYLIETTLRRDGSSKFRTHRYGWFPSITAGWRISQESFMNSISWLSDLKLRGGYGVMGNQLNVATDNAYTLFSGSQTASFYDIAGTSSDLVLGFRQARVGNPDAKWEKNENMNVGVDLSILDYRLHLTADYYRKDTRDLLYNKALIGAAGTATAPYVNVGHIKNDGIDLSLEGISQLTSDLRLDVNLNFTTYNNEIVKIAEGEEYFETETRRFGTAIIRNEVGHPISSYYGFQIDGFWNTDTEMQQANAAAQQATGNPSAVYQADMGLGRFRYRDVDGDGLITPEDRVFLGDPHPDFTYGATLGLNYKNIDLSLFLYGVQGAQIWNNVKWFTDFSNSFPGPRSYTALYESWTPDNPDAKVVRQEQAGSFSSNGVPNSYYVEDGSYLRLKSVVLGYEMPASLISRAGLRRLRLYVQGTNLFTITGYSGIDPEIGGRGNPTGFGIDEGVYTPVRQYTFGVNLSF